MNCTDMELEVAYGAAYVKSQTNDGVRVLLADREEVRTTPVERDDHLKRAVECWNACIGIKDPCTFMVHMNSTLQNARQAIQLRVISQSERDLCLYQLDRAIRMLEGGES